MQADDYDATAALSQMGEVIIGELQDSIIATNEPPLSEVTLMLRMMRGQDGVVTGRMVGEAAARVAAGERASGVNTKVLIDTGQMLNSITKEVE